MGYIFFSSYAAVRRSDLDHLLATLTWLEQVRFQTRYK